MENKSVKFEFSRARTAFTLSLFFVWLLLIFFAFVAATEPPWLKKLAHYGREDESRSMKEYGDRFMREKNYAMAIAQYQRALEIKPDFAEAMVNMSIAYNITGRGEQGLRILRDALKTGSIRSGPIYFNMADILVSQGKKEEAIELYRKSMGVEVEEEMVWGRLGVMYLENNQLENARDAFERALEIQTAPTTPYLNMAKTSLLLYEKDDEHRPVIEAMLEDDIGIDDLGAFDLRIIDTINDSDPEIAKTYNHLGAIYARLGDLDRAIAHFERSDRIWPGNIDARKNLPLLKSMKSGGAPPPSAAGP
jgi:tetratricopeptide (TPR) repeat protein